MTCEEFERVVTDLACEFLIEAASRKRGLAHARACSRCAVRLQQERGLAGILSEVANRETVQAPARLKTALLAAYQQQTGRSGMAGTIAERPPLQLAIPGPKPAQRPVWLMATAAALALAALLVAWQFSRDRLPQQPNVQPAPIEQAREIQPTQASEQTGVRQPDDSTPAQPSGVVQSASNPESRQQSVQPASPAGRAAEPQHPARRRMRPAFRPERADARQGVLSSETVTEFIPLTALTETTAINSGTIVRVEVPRASLLAMGLPMSVDRAQEIVKADIVVGDDGLARAIRLVY